ncbi:MAG: hypothetical protein AABX16_02525 [Nanoarchaeota archaeon]
METRSIKNVDEETWKKFKALAERNKMNMSILLKMMIREFEKQSKSFWREILTRGKNFTDEEANDIEIITKKIRKERGFRNELSI